MHKKKNRSRFLRASLIILALFALAGIGFVIWYQIDTRLVPPKDFDA